MLAFDIETEGLNCTTNKIIVASVYDPDRGIQRTFNFMADPSKFESERDAFLQVMEDAPSLCSFNGVRFDIPFIAAQFGVPPDQHGRWVLKTLDYFEICKLCFGSSCSLNNLLLANSLETKSSHGLQAMEWARQGNWRDVEDYCMRDAVLTHQVSTGLASVVIPLTGWSDPVQCGRMLNDQAAICFH